MGSGVVRWLNRPLSNFWCAAGWVVSTVVFVCIVTFAGGLSHVDSIFSTYSTWTIEHGQLRCAFPPATTSIAPLYPLLSGGLAAAMHVGAAIPFPDSSALGAHCQSTVNVISMWYPHAGALSRTLEIGYVGWLFLVAGIVLLLRASGRGRCGWEPAALLIVACLPPVWACVQASFHPEDLLAMGLALASMACALRNRWAWAGALVCLAILSQQFAILIALPLLVLAPGPKRARFAIAVAITGLVVGVPLLLATSERALHAFTQGSASRVGIGGTLVAAFGLRDAPLFLLSRVLPLILAVLVALWAHRWLGSRPLTPAILVSIVALSLSTRLIFEEAMYLQYFMAISVLIVLIEVSSRYLRASVVAWMIIVTMEYGLSRFLIFNGAPWAVWADHWLPLVALDAILVGIGGWAMRYRRGASWRTLLIWSSLFIGVLLSWSLNSNPFRADLPGWLWQIVLVGLGIVLAARPLMELRGSVSVDSELSPRTHQIDRCALPSGGVPPSTGQGNQTYGTPAIH